MSNKFGDNLKWFLSDVANSDKDQIEDGEIDIYGETEPGVDCSCSIKISDLCESALSKIEQLENERDKALLGEAHYTDKEQAVVRRLNAQLSGG